jgi:hypothetical protein
MPLMVNHRLFLQWGILFQKGFAPQSIIFKYENGSELKKKSR